jgi:hypothetical protein
MGSFRDSVYFRRCSRLYTPSFKAACFVGVSLFAAMPSVAWSQCAIAPDPLILNGTTCDEAGVARVGVGGDPVVSVTGGGTYTGTSVNLKNESGFGSTGISVSGANSQAILSGSTIETDKDIYQFGVSVGADGYFEAENTDITTATDHSDGILLDGQDATASLTGVTIETSGDGAEGIQAENLSRFTGSNVTIGTFGAAPSFGANAIMMAGGSTGELTNSSLTTQADVSSGVWTTGDNDFVGRQLTIETVGDFSDAIYNSGKSTVTLENSTLTTRGAEATGITLTAGSSVTLTDTQIETFGASAAGFLARSDPGPFPLQSVTIGARSSISTHGELSPASLW